MIWTTDLQSSLRTGTGIGTIETHLWEPVDWCVGFWKESTQYLCEPRICGNYWWIHGHEDDGAGGSLFFLLSFCMKYFTYGDDSSICLAGLYWSWYISSLYTLKICYFTRLYFNNMINCYREQSVIVIWLRASMIYQPLVASHWLVFHRMHAFTNLPTFSYIVYRTGLW